MEIIMQWLDDLDDLAFALIQAAERLRWPCLELGFAAACTLWLAQFADAVGVWVPMLACVALGSLVLWAAGLTLHGFPRVAGTAEHGAVSPKA